MAHEIMTTSHAADRPAITMVASIMCVETELAYVAAGALLV